MGQKVHPFGFRLGFNKTWRSRWYSDRDYAKLLHEDLALRQNLKKRFAHAGVSKIETERAAAGSGRKPAAPKAGGRSGSPKAGAKKAGV